MKTLIGAPELSGTSEVETHVELHETVDSEWEVGMLREIIGESTVMRQLKEKIRRLAQRGSTVLIVGETGTGKELVARALHYQGPRRKKALVCVNCPALSNGLMESELFGHEKGAFTGADRQRKGRFEVGDGGTILLDEVSEMHPDLQAKLLRVLQDRTFERVGSSRTLVTSARVVATTNRDLEQEVKERCFRKDLYFRLNVIPVMVPPLRERKEDIPALARAFVGMYGMTDATLSDEAVNRLMEYDWPGNVRQLENMIERACVMTDAMVLGPEHLVIQAVGSIAVHGGRLRSIEDMEREAIEAALEHFAWHQERAAASLGITSRTLRNKIRRYGFQR